jgi:uncharacterized protein (DUF952 family)
MTDSDDNDDKNLIFKVVSAQEWSVATKQGEFLGAAIDLTDGYIHFSTADQLRETVEKHFAGQADLLLVGVDANRLGDELKWEPSRGGALFPHLYAPLSMESVVMAADMPLGETGRHVIPISC